MKQNWQNGLDRFKALQTQARSTRDERNVLTKEVEELKAKLEAGTGGEAAAAAIVRSFFPFSDLSPISRLSLTCVVLDRPKLNLTLKLLSPNCNLVSPLSRLRRALLLLNSLNNKLNKAPTTSLSRRFKKKNKKTHNRGFLKGSTIHQHESQKGKSDRSR